MEQYLASHRYRDRHSRTHPRTDASPLLLAVFALWLLWWLLTQALPLWRNNRAYRAKEARLREQTAAANGGGQLADALLCHVNYRITAMLHAAYPNARWEWLADKPSRFAVEGGTARIRVYGIPDFDYADVKLDQKANLDCSLVKLSPLVAGASDTQPPNRQPVNPASGLRHGAAPYWRRWSPT